MKDPRRTNKGYFYYPLEEILFLCISSSLSGFDSWIDIELFGKEKIKWLKKFYPYKNGTPSHDVLGKLFARLDSEQFNQCFIQWVNELVTLFDGEVVAIDGKTARGSEIKGKRKALHIVSAYASKNKISLGQVATSEKSNEITAIPELLDLLAIKSCLVTIDAMGCQKKIAEKIIKKEADYLLMVKENQVDLLEQVRKMFKISPIESSFRNTDFQGGRIEERKCDIVRDLRFFDDKDDWKELKTVVRICSERHIKSENKIQKDTRYYISSSLNDAKYFIEATRNHWSVENNLHWNLDVIFKEDQSLKKIGNSAQNYNIISKIALGLIERETSTKASKPNKRNRAALSDKYREKLLWG